MKIMVFEDNENMPIPSMFKRYLGKNVVFTSGGRNMKKFLVKHISDEVICYPDYIRDNLTVVSEYVDMLARHKNDFNIKIVRIPCSEVFAYMLLNAFKINRKFNISDNIVAEYLLMFNEAVPDILYKEDSLEKYMKSVTEVQPNCTNTKNKKSPSFYVDDCRCSSEYCYSNIGDIANVDKFLYLYSLLPMRFKLNSDFSLGEYETCTTVDWNQIDIRSAYITCKNTLSKEHT